MRHHLLAGVLLLSAVTISMQERPDFSGTWVAIVDSAAPAGVKPIPPVYGPQFSIVHAGQSLTLNRTFGGNPASIAYVLDGSEVTSRMPGRLCEPDSGATWIGNWDGKAVTLTMVEAMPASGKPVKTDVKSTLRMESPDTLRVEVASRVPNQAAPRIASTSYRRSGGPPAATPPAVEKAPKARATIADVAWISGVWIGTAGPNTFEERWTPTAAGSMMSISRTLRDGAMSAFEFLCIVERDGGLVYSAMPNGRMPATDFTLTKIDADNAIFENPAHDFPKMIRYTRKADGSLEAVVSGEGGQKPQTFNFKRQ